MGAADRTSKSIITHAWTRQVSWTSGTAIEADAIVVALSAEVEKTIDKCISFSKIFTLILKH